MSYNQVVISSGHSINCQGASDVVNEVNEAKKVVNRVYDIVRANGKSCYKYHDTSYDVRQNLVNIVNFHNRYSDGIDVSVHFNANVHTERAMGVEVCYYSNSTLASQVSAAISRASGLRDRGGKQRTGLYFLRHTNKPSILIEVCFCDSVEDCRLYRNNFENICQAIAKALIGGLSNIPAASSQPSSDSGSVSSGGSSSISPVAKAKEYVGSRAKELQEKLIKCGYSCGNYGADGIFGQATYDALISFQKANGLSADGLAGPATFAKLDAITTGHSINSNSSSANDWVKRLQSECNAQGFSNQTVDGIPGSRTLDGCPTVRKGASGNITKLLQEKLVSLGYNTNGVDGIYGSGTANAVMSFQKAKGLSADGICGRNTWAKLLNL